MQVKVEVRTEEDEYQEPIYELYVDVDEGDDGAMAKAAITQAWQERTS